MKKLINLGTCAIERHIWLFNRIDDCSALIYNDGQSAWLTLRATRHRAPTAKPVKDRASIVPASLLSTKLYIPRPRPNAIARPRLTDKLLAGVNQPGTWVLLSGPAGFGKTTVLSDGVAQLQQPVAWLSLDERDNDPVQFWTYLIAACQSVQTGLGEAVLASLQSPQSLPDDMIPTVLINEIAQLRTNLILILDDYHVIQNQSIHAALAFLLDHLPAPLHLVLSTRLDPPWPLARFRARGQLIELRAADLRFTADEAAAFFNQVMDLPLSSEDVAALDTRTEGWIAGLQLAAIAMQSAPSMKGRRDLGKFVKALTGSQVYIADYLIEEVLLRQSAPIQDFLLKTSILNCLTASLCDAVTCDAVTGDHHGQAALLALQRANLFIMPLDDEGQWFRYHQLFADLLQARLRQAYSAEAIAALHQRAADWYEQSSAIPDAIEHALAAANYPYVVKLVEKIALPTILQAHVRTVESWLQAIPRAYLDQSPKAIMAWAWLHLLRGSAVQATPYLEQLDRLFASPEIGQQEPALLGEWLALQSKVLGLQGKSAESRDLANRALPLLPETEMHVRTMVYVNLAIAYQQMLDYDHAAQIFQRIVQEAQATGNFTLEILGISGYAKMALEQGQLQLGFELASQGIQRLETVGRSTPFSATFYGELGQIYYHWHQLEEARRYFSRSVQASGLSGYSDPEIYQHVMLSRMCQLGGDWSAAAGEMQQASDLARRSPPAMIQEEIISQQVRVELATDRLAAAQTLLKAEGFSFEDTLTGPNLTRDTGDTESLGLLYNSALRIVLYQNKLQPDTQALKRGIELASRVLTRELQCRHIPIVLETLLLRSQIYATLGDHANSLADVVQALQLAEPEGFISVFVEEGQPIAQALTQLLERQTPEADRANIATHTTFICSILAAFPETPAVATAQSKPAVSGTPVTPAAVIGHESSALVEPLTARELEVLHLIAAGDSNRVIAGKLVITVSAVKKHTGNIFGKLNVNSRTQAVARARQLGLLATDG